MTRHPAAGGGDGFREQLGIERSRCVVAVVALDDQV
jgi:hypothetical protein